MSFCAAACFKSSPALPCLFCQAFVFAEKPRAEAQSESAGAEGAVVQQCWMVSWLGPGVSALSSPHKARLKGLSSTFFAGLRARDSEWTDAFTPPFGAFTPLFGALTLACVPSLPFLVPSLPFWCLHSPFWCLHSAFWCLHPFFFGGNKSMRQVVQVVQLAAGLAHGWPFGRGGLSFLIL